MNHLLIGICGSSEIAAEILPQYLKTAESVFRIGFDIHIYSAGKELLNNYRPVYDILFLELPLDDMDTDKFFSQLRHLDSYVHIIVISDSLDSIWLGYDYGVNNCFSRSLWYRKIQNELRKCLFDDDILLKPSLWLSCPKGDFKLYFHKIRFIETNHRQLIFHYGNESLLYNGTLHDFEEKLAEHHFFRCNHSFIVNIRYIEKIVKDINRYSLHLVTGEVIPLSRDKKKVLLEMLRELDEV